MLKQYDFFQIFLEDISTFLGPLMPLVWIYSVMCLLIQNHSGHTLFTLFTPDLFHPFLYLRVIFSKPLMLGYMHTHTHNLRLTMQRP